MWICASYAYNQGIWFPLDSLSFQSTHYSCYLIDTWSSDLSHNRPWLSASTLHCSFVYECSSSHFLVLAILSLVPLFISPRPRASFDPYRHDFREASYIAYPDDPEPRNTSAYTQPQLCKCQLAAQMPSLQVSLRAFSYFLSR